MIGGWWCEFRNHSGESTEAVDICEETCRTDPQQTDLFRAREKDFAKIIFYGDVSTVSKAVGR